MTIEELKVISNLTLKLTELKLTELRQKECLYLCIENFAPELFAKLLDEMRKSTGG